MSGKKYSPKDTLYNVITLSQMVGINEYRRLSTCSSSLLKTVAVLSDPPVRILLVLFTLMSRARMPGAEAEWRPWWEAKVLKPNGEGEK